MRSGFGYRLGGFGRGSPRGLALAAVALAALMLDGCASDPCGSGCGTGALSKLKSCSIFNLGLRERLFHQKAVDACEPGIAGDCAPGAIGTQIMPGPGAVPSGEAIELSPAPGTTSDPAAGAAPGQGSSKPTGGQALNQPRRARDGTPLARRSPATRTATATPEPAPRPASGAAPASGQDDPLIDLPPLETPIDRRGASLAGVAPEADKIAKTGAEVVAPRPADEPKPSVAPVPGATPPAELPPKPIDTGFTPAPGIKRFKAVEPQLSGGSLPTAAGWDWLAETSYKTLLDLRVPQADRQPVLAMAASKAFRYVSMPVTCEGLDPDLFKRFLDELAMTGGRPLYFFDTEGTRPATLWYLKLVAIDKIDDASARKAVEELGTIDPSFEEPIRKCLARFKGGMANLPSAPAPAAAAPSVSSATGSPSPATPAAPVAPTTTPTAENKTSEAAPEGQPVTAAEEFETQAAAGPTSSWKSYATLIVSGLTVPLAYFGRSALHRASLTRASLPAPTHES
jgi:hypothetical protein